MAGGGNSAIFNMYNKYHKISKKSMELCTTEPYTGETLEEKVRRVEASGEPIEAIAPIIYTERKDGVKPEYNIRTDKWDVAQTAMDTIAQGTRQKRQERMNAATDKATATNSEMNVQQ